MKLMKRAGAVALASALTLSLMTGCAPKEAETTAPADTTAPAATTAPVVEVDLSTVTDPFLTMTGMADETVIATAGDYELTLGEVMNHVAYMADSMLSMYSAYGMTELPWTLDMGDGVTLDQGLLKDSMNSALLYAVAFDAAEDLGITLTDEQKDEIAADLANLKEEFGGDEQAAQYALWTGPTSQEYYEELYASNLLLASIYEHYFTEGGDCYLTDDEILADADANDYYKAKHILVMTQGIEDEAELAEKKALAEDILKQIRDSGNDPEVFDTLMNEHSEDGRDADGNLGAPNGYDAAPGDMVPEFETGALALKNGEISDLVETDYGYHIIMRLPLEFNDNMRADYESRKMAEIQNSWVEDLTIETNENYDKIDMATAYATLSGLRTAIGEELKEYIEAE